MSDAERALHAAGRVDTDRPNAARMYDYYLGGAHNFRADREAAERIIAASPHARPFARANRAFLAGAVRWCLARGITQFLDLGSGVPTAGNVHEVAQALDPSARVAYVDVEPVAVASAQLLIDDLGLENVTVTHADIRTPRDVLTAPTVAGLVDFTRPVAVLMVAILHFVAETDDLVDRIVADYRAPLVSGSAVAISHMSGDLDDPALAAAQLRGLDAYRHTANPATLRSRARLRELLTGLDVVEPGLVDVCDWPEPGATPGPSGAYGAVGVVPERRPHEGSPRAPTG